MEAQNGTEDVAVGSANYRQITVGHLILCLHLFALPWAWPPFSTTSRHSSSWLQLQQRATQHRQLVCVLSARVTIQVGGVPLARLHDSTYGIEESTLLVTGLVRCFTGAASEESCSLAGIPNTICENC
ncbi:unnamed protein product [Caenorhabditis auriculariae]|uniref:Uncharacterized protein n=1 Tax=Caenorhabditis auriculariae TaxID=2777116 RepID=A0A8S1HNM3_9PELO|nr:unnamed protein product [Caenorhabditis auriculariae]